jgi:hypothetical protein
MEHNQLTIKTFMAIMAERDAAIRERNMALEERKRAFAERDMAMLQRDAALSERNSAIQERNDAIATLRYQSNPTNENNNHELEEAVKHKHHNDHHDHHHHHQTNHMFDLAEANKYGQCEVNCSNNYHLADDHVADDPSLDDAVKPRKVRQIKERKSLSVKPAKFQKTGPKGSRGLIKQDFGGNEENINGQQNLQWKSNLGLNQVNFDETSMPVPVCSCTGVPQPCYKWGSGGWQSACCTTALSMYPLPQSTNKRYSRIGGRKMSGSVFAKLLNRLADEGYDLSTPLDLKVHWAKHGTNRYSTLR